INGEQVGGGEVARDAAVGRAVVVLNLLEGFDGLARALLLVGEAWACVARLRRPRHDGGLGDLDGLGEREVRRVGAAPAPPREEDGEDGEGDDGAHGVEYRPAATLEAVREAFVVVE